MIGIIYGDIHHHHWTTGVTLDDSLGVEQQINDCAKESRADFVLFLGDRFESRNPHDEVKVAVDCCLKDRDGILRIPTFYLIGNHDQYFKSQNSGHTLASCKLFGGQLPNSQVMDEARTYSFQDLPDLLIHALPAGFEFSLKNYVIVPKKINLFVMHDLLQGTLVDLNGHKYGHMSPTLIDHACFDFVFSGDAHIPQRMPLTKTKGGYIGSTMQHTRRDRGDERGWVRAQMVKEAGFVMETEFFPSRSPRFLDVEVCVPATVESVIQRMQDQARRDWGQELSGNIVTVTVRGVKDEVDKISKRWKEEVQSITSARLVKIVKNPDTTIAWEIKGIEQGDNTAERDLQLYMQSGLVDLEGLDPARIEQKAHEVFDKVK